MSEPENKKSGTKLRMMPGSGHTVENTLRIALERADEFEDVVVVALGNAEKTKKNLHVFASAMDWKTACYIATALQFDTGLGLFRDDPE